jgi:membrane-bound inhibitor of C-type lysozyme
MRHDIGQRLPRIGSGGGNFRSRARIFLILPIAALISCNTTPTATAASTFTYTCADGGEVQVAHSSDGTASSVTLTFEGDSAILAQVRAASGAKYSNGSLTWWEKGDSGMVLRDDKVVRRDCRKG